LFTRKDTSRTPTRKVVHVLVELIENLSGAHGDKADDSCLVPGKRHIGFAEAAPSLLSGLAQQEFIQRGIAAIETFAAMLRIQQPDGGILSGAP